MAAVSICKSQINFNCAQKTMEIATYIRIFSLVGANILLREGKICLDDIKTIKIWSPWGKGRDSKRLCPKQLCCVFGENGSMSFSSPGVLETGWTFSQMPDSSGVSYTRIRGELDWFHLKKIYSINKAVGYRIGVSQKLFSSKTLDLTLQRLNVRTAGLKFGQKLKPRRRQWAG